MLSEKREVNINIEQKKRFLQKPSSTSSRPAPGKDTMGPPPTPPPPRSPQKPKWAGAVLLRGKTAFHKVVWVKRSDRRMVRMFQRLDRDGDLSVTKAEVERPTSRIVSMMDSNGDGVLSMEDHRRHHGGWGQGKRGGN